MLDKMIGVSPPQAGEARETKVTDLNDFRGSAEKSTRYKEDFERALKEKSWMQKKDLEKKNETARREELRAEKNKKSSGGTKKKMTEVDEKMVSSGMASNESVVETPVSKVEETAKIKVSTEQAPKISEDLKAQSINGVAQANAMLEEQPVAGLSGDAEAMQAALEAQTAQAALDAQAEAPQNAQHLNAVVQELGSAVQYESSEALPKADVLLKQEASATEAKAADQFEKNVLQQLQKESAFSGQSSSDSDQQGLEQSDKQELGTSNELHQAAGQTHTGFKGHLESVQNKPGLDVAGRLEQNREANINEIMNQADYLVKKGGGEVSVKMSPEGMGEVQLKVQLLNGKLSIEMQTQDRDVKKMIEDSLSDLKSGLAAHRISLEHVKVDTVAATNTDNSAQMQSNLNQGRQDGQTQNAWTEVQQQMQNQSGGSGQRQSQKSERALNLEPVSLTQVSQAKGLRTYGGTKGSTINRVA